MTASDSLIQLGQLGQAPWLDSIGRDWLDSGELVRLRDDFALRGVTSNPSIFQAALKHEVYDSDVRALASQGLDDRAIFHRLAIDDIRRACDVFLPVHEATEHRLHRAPGRVVDRLHAVPPAAGCGWTGMPRSQATRACA